jgi:5-methylcytosine-specific restriction endonuclease McrA
VKTRRRVVSDNPYWCYLCGLPIPAEIVSPSHPLFETVDHVIPVSRNDRDMVRNRAPAHRVCNLAKGNGMIDPEVFAAECQ